VLSQHKIFELENRAELPNPACGSCLTQVFLDHGLCSQVFLDQSLCYAPSYMQWE